jgi:glucoamylase
LAKFRGKRTAPGKPGIEPCWTHGDKQGVGTAYSISSYIWFTTWSGIITEIYCPTIDRAQVQFLEYIVTDGKTFCQEEKSDLISETERMSDHVLGYRITNYDPDQRYAIVKEIISAPNLPCVLQHTRLKGNEDFLSQLHLYSFLAPHLEMGGWNNNAYVVEIAGRELLVAEKKGAWLATAATIPFKKLSCGYMGQSDGYKDIADNYQMDWEFDRALDGNVTLTGELDLGEKRDFTLGVALGNSLHSAVTSLFQALAIPFKEQKKEYVNQWEVGCDNILPLEGQSKDKGNLYHSSYSLILGHEDKTFRGAFIASLSIPWGESKGDDDIGGYHLVWTRDMAQVAAGLLAAGNTETPQRALIYLGVSQQPDGAFPQNFWINGTPYWQGIQLDEVSFPIILAWRIQSILGSLNFNIYPLVKQAAGYLLRYGPATQQERWEEAGGYSPSTLAANIAALICAADFARKNADEDTARYLEEYADFLECHIEPWTVTNQGTLVPGIKRHYIRIHPLSVTDYTPDEDPDHGILTIPNYPPGVPNKFPAKDIVDAGFLELVRYGIRRPGDPLIEDSLRIVDAVLKVDTPLGPCWHRYNHDGYGQREDGGSYMGWGKGRIWPLLVGERAHYEFAAGRDIGPLIKTMEQFASRTGLIPEQAWDSHDIPELHLYLGKPTSSAMPLVWAHAEYIKLLRSVRDGKVFDLIPAVANRYLSGSRKPQPREIWKPIRQLRSVPAGWPLRIQAAAPFLLHWTNDDWKTAADTRSKGTALGVEFVDIEVPPGQKNPLKFTFLWTGSEKWEGRDYEVEVIT